MRKILIILLLLFGVFSTNAQIQRQILGYTFGVSTRSVVVKGLEAKGFDLEIVTDAANKGPVFYLVKGGVSFGGYIWDDVRIGFVNGKFASIMCTTYLIETQSVKLKNTLQSKYNRYKTVNTNPTLGVYDFNDKKTSAFLYIPSSGNVVLSYGDERLMNAETNSSSTNDL